jgi:hypothetical protein
MSGYTYGVQKGEITEFKDFALRCARVFGYLGLMKDMANDAEIPDEIVPNPYNSERLAEYEKTLQELLNLTPREIKELATKDYYLAYKVWGEINASYETENCRIWDMSNKVEAWTPPTVEHIPLKNFMLEQLNQEYNETKYNVEPKMEPPADWYERKLKRVQEDIEYFKKKVVKEEAWAYNATKWVKALKESLK